MATYFVRVTGSNANDGLAKTTAFADPDYAQSVMTAGDDCWVGAGIYRVNVTMDNSGSSGSPIQFFADIDGTQTGDAGQVIISAHDNDAETSTRASVLDFNGKTFFEWHGFLFIGGTSFVIGNTAYATATAYEGVVINNCTVVATSATWATTIELNAGVTPTTNGIAITRCTLAGGFGCQWDSNASAIVNIKATIAGSRIFGRAGQPTMYFQRVTNGGSFAVGGFTIYGNTLWCSDSYGIYFMSATNTTNPTYIFNNLIINSASNAMVELSATTGFAIIGNNRYMACGSGASSTYVSVAEPDAVNNGAVLLGGVHDQQMIGAFGFSPFLPFEPMSGISGYTNPAIDIASNLYTQDYDIYGNARQMGRATVEGNLYYFDASDAAATDPNAVWGTEANIFDASLTTSAVAGTAGSNSSNYAMAEGTNAPSSGGTIAKVRTRIRYAGSTATARTVGWEVYTDSLGESLGSFTQAMSATTQLWSAWHDLTVPSGGWTWAKAQALETKVWSVTSVANVNVYQIQIGVITDESSPDIGAVEARPQAQQESTTVYEGSYSFRLEGTSFVESAVGVPASATSIKVQTRWDSNYSGSKPKLVVLGITGVADQTDTATGSANAWEELVCTFTPTAACVVRVQMWSQDTSTNGYAYFDNITVE